MNNDRIKDKIRKLINLSEGAGATQGEIDNAIDAATRLMAQHNVTREDIDRQATGPQAVKDITLGRHVVLSYGVNLTTWEGHLMLWVCDFVGYCQCYKSPTQTVVKSGIIIRDFKGTPLKRAPIYFYGSDDSAQSAAELFEEIRDAIIKLAYIRFNGFATGNGAAYCLGFVSGLQEQLRSSQLRLEASDAQTTALVLADKKNQLALQDRSRDWLDAKHGIKLRSRSSSFGGYKDTKGASAAGRKDGRNYSAEKRTPKGRRLA